MVSEFRPLVDVLRELSALVHKKVSGYFFIATESNQSSTILLRKGHVDEVTFSRYRSDEAVKHLALVSAARARFQPSPVDVSSKRTPPGEAALQWLLGGFEKDIAARARASVVTESAPVASPPAPAPVPAPIAAPAPGMDEAARREAVEHVALTYLGPIAILLCDEAFSASDDMDKILQNIASNLSTPEEATRFVQEARSTLGK
jgi:hypothetical protein